MPRKKQTMAFESTESFYEVRASTVVRGPYPRSATGLGQNSSDGTLATYGHYRLWVDDGGSQPGQYWRQQQGNVLVDEVAVPPRCTRTDVWVEFTAQEKRSAIDGQIEIQRSDANRPYLDVQADAGLVGLMDEANANAVAKRAELNSTDDAGLEAFDSTFDPRALNAIQVAASLSRQERSILAAANPFTEQQRSDLALAATQHEAIVDAGDPTATVQEVPTFARRMIGTPGEEYGFLMARRIFINPWYWLEVEFEITRDIDADDYFLAIYDNSAPDDRNDTTAGYLSTAQFQVVSPGRLIAPKESINLQRAIDFEYKLTICKAHLSFPQFDRVLFEQNLLFDEWRARWGGSVQYNAPT